MEQCGVSCKVQRDQGLEMQQLYVCLCTSGIHHFDGVLFCCCLLRVAVGKRIFSGSGLEQVKTLRPVRKDTKVSIQPFSRSTFLKLNTLDIAFGALRSIESSAILLNFGWSFDQILIDTAVTQGPPLSPRSNTQHSA